MADKTTTNFPKMGTEAAYANNVSAAPSPNTTAVPKHGGVGGSSEGASASIRPHVMERNGFKGAPQMTLAYNTAPEAGQTYRNVRLVQSAVGNRDFYNKRQYGQVSQ